MLVALGVELWEWGQSVLDVGGGGILSMVERSRVYVVVSVEISAKRQVRRSVSRLAP